MADLKNSVNPLTWNVPIVDKLGRPTDEFQRKWAQQASTNDSIPDLTTAAAVSEVLDLFSTARGSLLARGVSAWGALPIGGANTILKSTGSDPAWASLSSMLDTIGNVQGDVLYRNAAGWTVLAPGTAGQVLTTGGAAANPSWAAASGSGGGAASAQDDGTTLYLALSDTDGQLILDGSGDPVFVPEVVPKSAVPVVSNPITVITATGNFTTPADSSVNTVYRYRAVGAGGGSAGNNRVDNNYGLTGGGGGEYMEGTFTGVAPGTNIPITIGAGGTAGTSAPTAGGDGGDTIIGAPVNMTAHGGKGSLDGSTPRAPSAGGTGSTAPFHIDGQASGQGGLTSYGAAAGGPGGNSMLGFGGRGTTSVASNATAGQLYGGGAGGSRASGAFDAAGALGAKGVVIIERLTL